MPPNSAKWSKFWKNAVLGKFFNPVDLPPEVVHHSFSGSGSLEDPYIVGWMPGDNDNPMNFRDTKKWLLNLLGAFSAFTVALVSSAYSGALARIVMHFATSEEVALLGVSLFVIGFAVGPLMWATLSELYGRRYILVASGAALTVTLAGIAGAHNIETLLILRFLAGSLGSAPMAVPAGIIADLFPPATRGLALGLFVVGSCVPIPYLFYIYGARIRKRCHYAAVADAFMERLLEASKESTAPTKGDLSDSEVSSTSPRQTESVPQRTASVSLEDGRGSEPGHAGTDRPQGSLKSRQPVHRRCDDSDRKH
ncbi:unnamed protein product [Penicillium salamii]|nr:unnamed protein product [Penicillium salamii]CAG7965225.1 unnamed protein product [Penicillium salamii]CAG8418448.1 unnamed protein product [Penicillium salamii]